MERSVVMVGALMLVTIWLVVDLIKNKGKSMTKIVTRATIFFIMGGWLLYLVLYGNLLANVPNNGVYQIFIAVASLVMVGLFVAPHVKVEKGTPTYELIKGALIMVVICIIALIILVSLGPEYINSL
ncbi:hypothetical protein [Acetobacterium bakii]|uniref:Uncharacterized protein n=1 Tax=Acetobacterium bakii TaxID=52689 RepID=A0A0L6U553_9FIRM|nr:hypothetical protein [Acetobacterium bakii]KNZ43452.1 hypothetical protein AKG39_00665 [Acetobacterium bakii]